MALRGQELPSLELLEFRYRERFGLSEKELGEESLDIFNLNLSIIDKINEISTEENAHRESSTDRLNR